MNRSALTSIAPEIFRKRLLIEGFYDVDISEATLAEYFHRITTELGLRTYGDPVIHSTGGKGKEMNEGYDGFVPLIDSGIYIGVWVNPRFMSTIIYTCAPFDEDLAVSVASDFFWLREHEAAVF